MSILESFQVPFRNPISDDGVVTIAWQGFFRSVFERLRPLGVERQFTLENNKSTATNITGLKLNAKGQTCVIMEYLVQRVSDSVELTEFGMIVFVYNPDSASWSKVTISEANPDDAGITLTIGTDGQVKYQTSNAAGTFTISSIYYRLRSLAGKSQTFSSVGAS